MVRTFYSRLPKFCYTLHHAILSRWRRRQYSLHLLSRFVTTSLLILSTTIISVNHPLFAVASTGSVLFGLMYCFYLLYACSFVYNTNEEDWTRVLWYLLWIYRSADNRSWWSRSSRPFNPYSSCFWCTKIDRAINKTSCTKCDKVSCQLVVHNCNHRFQAKDGEKNHHEHIDRNILTYNEIDPPCSSSTSDHGISHCRTILSSLAHICR